MNKTRIPLESIDQACSWMARLLADDTSDQEQRDCLRWRQADPGNEAAWQQLQRVQSRFNSLPDRTAGSNVLAARPSLSRRQLLALAGVGAGVGLLGLGSIGPGSLRQADLRTPTGGLARHQLADGTQLVLNTATRVDVDISATQREIHLLEGEIWVATGTHPLPLRVYGRDGVLTTLLGTEFNVRQWAHQTRLSVFQGQVLVAAKQGAELISVSAGEGLAFAGDRVQERFVAQTDSTAWLQGKLAAADMPLTNFLAELGRYRPGILRVSPTLANQRVTGVFSVHDTDRVLTQLAEVLPIRIQKIGPWWVSVQPA